MAHMELPKECGEKESGLDKVFFLGNSCQFGSLNP